MTNTISGYPILIGHDSDIDSLACSPAVVRLPFPSQVIGLLVCWLSEL
jgi:hypothetical protein